MTASTDEQREELARRLPNVIRVVAGICASSSEDYAALNEDEIAETALAVVLACEAVCGIGADDE